MISDKKILSLVNTEGLNFKIIDYIATHSPNSCYVCKMERHYACYGMGLKTKQLIKLGIIEKNKKGRKHLLILTKKGKEIYSILKKILMIYESGNKNKIRKN